MYTLDILSKTLSFTLTASSQVTLRLGVDVFYTGSGTSFSIPLPLKHGQVQEGAYVLNINGTETILSYKFPTEVPDIVWDVNGLLSTLSVSDNKAYTGTIISQSIDCTPPAPLVAKTGLNKINYTPNIYSGDWSIIRRIKLSYDAGNGLNVINTIENTYTEIVLNINAKNLYQAVTNYIKSFVENCSPQREIAKFTKVNAYLQQYENYIELVDYENAYNSLVKAGELVGVDKTIQEIIPFTINENGGGCCDKDVVPAHTAYFGFSEVALMTDSIAKTLSIEKYNIYAHRDWHMSQDGITSRFAYIVVPTSVAALIAMVKLKGGLLAVWESQLITIDGIPYTAIKSPNKFFDKDATFVTDALDDCDIALQWVNSNGSEVESHIGDESLHLKQGDRTKLDNLSGINTGDQDLSGLEPKRGANDFYVTDDEKNLGTLATGITELPTVNDVANITDKYVCHEISNIDYHLEGKESLSAYVNWSVIPYKGNGMNVTIKFIPKSSLISYCIVDWNEVVGSTGVVVTKYGVITETTVIPNVIHEISNIVLPSGKFIAISGCGAIINSGYKPFQYFQSLTTPIYFASSGLSVEFTYISPGIYANEINKNNILKASIIDVALSDSKFKLVSTTYGLPVTTTHGADGTVKIDMNPISSSGDRSVTYYDNRDNKSVHVLSKANEWLVFAKTSSKLWLVNQNGNQIFNINLATGGASGTTSIVGGYNILSLLDKEFYIIKNTSSIDIYLQNGVIWVSVPLALINDATPTFGAIAYESSASAKWWCVVLGAFSKDDLYSSRLDYNTITSVSQGAEMLVVSKLYPNGVAKMAMSSATAGKTIQLYGDSISSANWTWYKDYLSKYTGAIVANDGFSGYATRALSSNFCFQKVIDTHADFIIYLVGGNDTGSSGTVGTFDALSPNGLIGEAVTAESNVTSDFCTDGQPWNNNNYQSLVYIVAVSHFIRKWKAAYYDFRARAGLTGSETEIEKTAKLDATYRPRLILCTTLPQKRNNSTDEFSKPLNWQRKINAIKECASKYDVDIIDFSDLYKIDMAVEPYYTVADMNNNKGTYTLDGVHPNKYGYDRLARIVSDYMKRF